jgi:hypothetical protein
MRDTNGDHIKQQAKLLTRRLDQQYRQHEQLSSEAGLPG